MIKILDCFREMTQASIILRLALAVLCGGLIGIEREVKHRAAGFRTHILICMGAAMTTLTSQFLYLSGAFFTDPARLGAQVIAGIGFIGAGAILVTRQNRIKGLTTAAGLWVCALIGLSCGAGYAECAVSATFIILFAELFLIKLENAISANIKERRYCIEYEQSFDLRDISKSLLDNGIRVMDMEILSLDDENGGYTATLSLRPQTQSAGKKLSNVLSATPKILKAERL